MSNVRLPHFFATHSRLGLTKAPYHSRILNIGVEDGPDAILSSDFVKKYPGVAIHDFHFSRPEDVDRDNYYRILAKELGNMADLITKNLKKDETQVVVGGDHSVAFSSLLSVVRRKGADNIGHIQFDSHGDINLIASAPKGNFHGMWLRPFLSTFDNQLIDELIPHKVQTSQIIYVGNVEFDPEEKIFVKKNKVAVFGRNDRSSLLPIKNLISKFAHIHVSFDIDVFRRDLSPATGTPSLDGLLTSEIFPLLEPLKKAGSISIDLVEVNPKKKGAEKTVMLAQEVLQRLI